MCWPFRDIRPSCSAGSVPHLFSNEWNCKASTPWWEKRLDRPALLGEASHRLIVTSKEWESPLLPNRSFWRPQDRSALRILKWNGKERQGESGGTRNHFSWFKFYFRLAGFCTLLTSHQFTYSLSKTRKGSTNVLHSTFTKNLRVPGKRQSCWSVRLH